MLKVGITYVQANRRELPIIESMNSGTIRETAERILREYSDGAARCEDEVVAALLREEGRQAEEVLRVAGIDVAGEH